MGGGVGVGNRSAVAGLKPARSRRPLRLHLFQNIIFYVTVSRPTIMPFSLLIHGRLAEAAQILLNIPVKKIMMPLNVTHTAIATAEVQAKLNPENTPPTDQSLRYTISTIISFFADAYKSTFGFVDGPPLHDCLCVAAISRPDMFRMKRYRVDVELNGTHTSGETVVDIWNYRDCDETWGSTGKNCLVTEFVDVRR